MKKAIDSQSRGRQKPVCAKCRIHGHKCNLANHKPCKYENCVCKLCIYMTATRKCMAVKTQIMRRLEGGRTLMDIETKLPAEPFFDFDNREGKEARDDNSTGLVKSLQPFIGRKIDKYNA
ncbi:hypothetical protein TNCT_393721 [Trichonephila clavata]|uniref:DM domain-containing protein n=1 Tax=Trichonephila clavata TaxID=2740835 RepID=A0A8X6IQ91_TRICU|nr:hypothetical protein TNCT_393721 [Trichonephila clavata]